MLNLDEIKEFLKSENRIIDFNVRLRPSDEAIMVYVPQLKVVPTVKKGFISVRQINNLRKKVSEKFSREVEFILIQDDTQQDLEAGFFQILNRKFNDQIISLYISFREDSVVDAFIEAVDLSDELRDEITAHFESLLREAEFNPGVFKWLNSPTELPTLMAILRVLKAYQPVNLEGLVVKVQMNYTSVTEAWLNNKLDQLRKKGLVMRQKDNATYVLTNEALKIVPAGTRRTSSDIDRALALGKRKW